MRQKLRNNPMVGGPKNLIFIVFFFMACVFMLTWLTDYTRHVKSLNYSAFMKLVEDDQVKSVHISGQDVYGVLKDGTRFEAIVADNPSNWELLKNHNVEFSVAPTSNQFTVWHMILFTILLMIPLGIWFFLRQARGGSGGANNIFNMGKSRARLFMPSMINERFDSVAGAREAKQELKDIVDFLKSPDKYRRLGAKIPRGVLLVGEPGNGKTLLAKTVAGEANCPFFSITGSDFIEVFVGVGAARVRDLFAKARQHAPCIVFIDEIDAIGRQRGSGFGGGHDEREQTLNQLLTEMDGFESSQAPAVIVLAATNIPEVLDKALLRPGRFDRRIDVPYPDLEGREQILKIHANKIKLGPDVDFNKIALDTAGFSGADLANLVNKAALTASKNNKERVSMEELLEAHKSMLQAGGSYEGGGAALMTKGNAKPKMFVPTQVKVKFDDVAGIPEAKEELQELVGFLKNPEKYRRLGAKLTRGVLLVGDPGNGKTLLAKAVAGEANCPFFSVSASDFVEIYVGVGASRVRDLFAQARRHMPSIIFIDEIDAVGSKRFMGADGGNEERNQTLNQLLTEMDGFNTGNSSIIIMAATNRPDVLDSALLRPGRFDKTIEIPYPDLKSREQILKVHTRGVTIDPTLDLHKIARGTPGFSGADLAHLINESALIATQANKDAVTMFDIENARDKIMLGKELRSILLSDEERNMIAFHEAGHALVRLLTPQHADPLHKVTIVPRGKALGVTHSLPEKEKYLSTKDEMLTLLMVCLGGRIAEQLVFDVLSSGASDDFQKATDIARKMVCNYGMTDELGPVVYAQGRGDFTYSQKTAEKIDEVVHKILREAQEKTYDLLQKNRDKLDKLAHALLEQETMYADQIYALLGIKPRESFRLTEDEGVHA